MLAVVLGQGAAVAVETIPPGPDPDAEAHQPFEQAGPPALEHAQPGVGGQVPGEGQTQGEDPVVVVAVALGRQQLLEQGPTSGGDAVDLLASAARAPAGPEASGVRGARRRTGFDDLDRSRGLQSPQRRIERPERHAAGEAQRVRQLPLQLVAVERLFGEQPEDGKFEHGNDVTLIRGTRAIRGTPPILVAIDVSSRYIDRNISRGGGGRARSASAPIRFVP